jgi:molybdenum cofactor guanylyltransferase
MEHSPTPIIGICGFSGSGKTTLIHALLGHLLPRNLWVLVVKHDAHGLNVDRKGSDTERLFGAGADVLARDPGQSFLRLHAGDREELSSVLARQAPLYDLILVEGHKNASLPHKIWLRRHRSDRPPAAVGAVSLDLGRDANRVEQALALVLAVLDSQFRATPIVAGVLIGGRSSRMGRPKHLLTLEGRLLLEHVVAAVEAVSSQTMLLGGGDVPQSLARLARLPDAPDFAGPVAGMVAAMRWHPRARWLFCSCDGPWVSAPALHWLTAQMQPGVWAVLPRRSRSARCEPFPGLYDFRVLPILESVRGPSVLADHSKCVSPVIPASLQRAWRNVNTPAAAKRAGLSGWEPSGRTI